MMCWMKSRSMTQAGSELLVLLSSRATEETQKQTNVRFGSLCDTEALESLREDGEE